MRGGKGRRGTLEYGGYAGVRAVRPNGGGTLQCASRYAGVRNVHPYTCGYTGIWDVSPNARGTPKCTTTVLPFQVSPWTIFCAPLFSHAHLPYAYHVCVSHPIYSRCQTTCGRTSRGHTGGRSHMISPPSFCGACLNFYREKNSAVHLPRRP